MSVKLKRCDHLVVKPSLDGKIRAFRHVAYKCACPVPPMPVLPASITEAYGFRPWVEASKRYVYLEICELCPLHTGKAK